jgi:hypothetical protein
MNQQAANIQRQVLSEAFQAAVEGWTLRSAVFLTFRFDPAFFEQEVLPVFFDISLSQIPQARVLHLADALRTTGPVAVYYDRGALEAGAGSPRTNFEKIGIVHRTGYFHPKNVLLLLEKPSASKEESVAGARRLIVASMSANLTRAGWWENVEVAHIECVDDRSECSFAADLRDLLTRVRRASPQGADHSALDEVTAFVTHLVPASQRISEGLLRPRLYSGGDDVTVFLENLAGNRLRRRCLEIISPYFDETESVAPLHALIDTFKPRETRVFLPTGVEGEALCSEAYWQAVKDAGANWGQLPEDVVFLSKSRDRTVHAKVYRFFDPDDRRQTFFVGSVNLTNAGFSHSGNVESGFVVEIEGRRRSDWWLLRERTAPTTFYKRSETESLADGPGARLVLRFNWTTGAAHAIWDKAGASPVLALEGAGVPLAVLGPLPPRETVFIGETDAKRLQEHLVSSSFVSVAVEGESAATILVEEEGTVDKPSLLSRLPPEEILRYWSLLTDDQKSEFYEEHADKLSDDDVARWVARDTALPADQGMFATFAHIYLSFGNLEKAVRKALAANRAKEAVDRLFGKKFDSLRRLVERLPEKEQSDPVADYVTLLCALQILQKLQKDYPEFASVESRRFELLGQIRHGADDFKSKIRLDPAFPGGRAEFFTWLEKWFLLRATPSQKEAAS